MTDPKSNKGNDSSNPGDGNTGDSRFILRSFNITRTQDEYLNSCVQHGVSKARVIRGMIDMNIEIDGWEPAAVPLAGKDKGGPGGTGSENGDKKQ